MNCININCKDFRKKGRSESRACGSFVCFDLERRKDAVVFHIPLSDLCALSSGDSPSSRMMSPERAQYQNFKELGESICSFLCASLPLSALRNHYNYKLLCSVSTDNFSLGITEHFRTSCQDRMSREKV